MSEETPQKNSVDEAYELKRMLMQAQARHSSNDYWWKALAQNELMEEVLDQVRLNCDAIGFRQGDWQSLSRDEQLDIAHVLADRRLFRHARERLNNPNAGKTYVPAIDEHLDLDRMKTMHFGAFEGADPEVFETVSDMLFHDAVAETELDYLFPHNCNPAAMDSEQYLRLRAEGELTPDELAALDRYAETRRDLPRPQYVVSSVTMDNDGRIKRSDSRLLDL